MADVFISYAREDRQHAERIAQGLTALGLESWWDGEIPPGQTWADYTESKLSQCKTVIVLWSEHSTKSQWVREEARMGREKSKLIPAMLDKSQPPFGFGEVQAADLSTWGGDYNHPQWTRFSQAVYGVVRGGPIPPPAQPSEPQAQPQAAWTPPPQAQPQPQASGWQVPPAQPQASWTSHGAQAAQPGAAEPQLTPIGYIEKCLRLFIDGKGRARRAEYWWWILASVVVSIVAAIIDLMFGINAYTGQPNSQIISTLVSLALLAPSASVMSRRFHDVGYSGWFVAGVFGAYVVGGALVAMQNVLGSLIVLATGIGVIIVAVMPSKPGPNEYGPNPKGL